jgi:stage V sporulation protein SpoVS
LKRLNEASSQDGGPAVVATAIAGLLRFHGIAAEPEKVARDLAGDTSSAGVVRYLGSAGLKARAVTRSVDALARVPRRWVLRTAGEGCREQGAGA